LQSFSSLRWVKWGDPSHYGLYIPAPPNEKSYYEIDKRETMIYLRPLGGGETYDAVKIDTGGSVKHRGQGWRGERAKADSMTRLEAGEVSDYMKAVEQQIREKDLHAEASQEAHLPAGEDRIEDLSEAGYSVNEQEITQRTARLLLDAAEIREKVGAIRSGEQGDEDSAMVLM